MGWRGVRLKIALLPLFKNKPVCLHHFGPNLELFTREIVSVRKNKNKPTYKHTRGSSLIYPKFFYSLLEAPAGGDASRNLEQKQAEGWTSE